MLTRMGLVFNGWFQAPDSEGWQYDVGDGKTAAEAGSFCPPAHGYCFHTRRWLPTARIRLYLPVSFGCRWAEQLVWGAGLKDQELMPLGQSSISCAWESNLNIQVLCLWMKQLCSMFEPLPQPPSGIKIQLFTVKTCLTLILYCLPCLTSLLLCWGFQGWTPR